METMPSCLTKGKAYDPFRFEKESQGSTEFTVCLLEYEFSASQFCYPLQIYILIETEGTFTIRAKLNSSNHHKSTRESTVDDFSYAFEAQYLPPIFLTLLLPKAYPSHLPPHFTVSTQWLDPVKISHLCSMLASMWMEQPGQEVIYRWAE